MSYKPGTKVVCINDQVILNGLAEYTFPQGHLKSGEVYTVIGETMTARGAGLLLKECSAIWNRDGEENGFFPQRFVSLEYFEAEFVSSTAYAWERGENGHAE